MGKGLPRISLQLETANSALSVLRTLLAEKLHEDDRVKLDELINRAENALDNAADILNQVRGRLNETIERL